MFYHNLFFSDNALYLTNQVNGLNITLNKKVLFKVLGVPTEGIRFLGNKRGSEKFLKVCGKLDDMNIKNVSKRL